MYECLVIKFTEAKTIEEGLLGLGRREWGLVFRLTVPILQDGKSSEDWLQNMNILNATQLETVKTNFMLCIFATIFF